MAQPDFIPQAFAENGDRNVLPDSSTTAASWAQGFPPITALPLSSGGVAPDRKDFNAVLFSLAAHAVFSQVGGVYEYSTSMNYDTPAIIAYDSKLYFCVKANGASSTVVSPADDPEGEYWQNIDYGGESVATQMVASIPNCYRRAELMTPNKTSITVHENTQVNINGKGYISTKDVTLELGDVLSASSRAGTDMYVYACQPESSSSTEPDFVLSANSTVPSGYTADNSRKIGGFHCLCADVGTISGHTLSGYSAGDVLPLSVWDLIHRAQSENEGMVWIEEIGAWVDIYIASWDGSALVSEFGGSTVTGTAGGKMMHGDLLCEYFGLVKKRLIWRDEFVVMAKGSNEGTNISGSANPGTVGGHSDTAGRRMISNYGLEDCCGVYWQWTQDLFGAFNAPAGSTYSAAYGQYGGANTSDGHYIQGCGWDDSYASYNRAMNPTLDGDDNFGGWYGVVCRFHVGAYWSYGTHCGSRSVHVNFFPSYVSSYRAGRGAAGPRVVYTS